MFSVYPIWMFFNFPYLFGWHQDPLGFPSKIRDPPLGPWVQRTTPKICPNLSKGGCWKNPPFFFHAKIIYEWWMNGGFIMIFLLKPLNCWWKINEHDPFIVDFPRNLRWVRRFIRWIHGNCHFFKGVSQRTPPWLGHGDFPAWWNQRVSCQNSYWKWPFIVDLPIKNGDFP
jgi:hypothetical protein